MIKMCDDFQKMKSTFTTYIKIERIDLNVYLHSRNISSINSVTSVPRLYKAEALINSQWTLASSLRND